MYDATENDDRRYDKWLDELEAAKSEFERVSAETCEIARASQDRDGMVEVPVEGMEPSASLSELQPIFDNALAIKELVAARRILFDTIDYLTTMANDEIIAGAENILMALDWELGTRQTNNLSINYLARIGMPVTRLSTRKQPYTTRSELFRWLRERANRQDGMAINPPQ